MFKYFTNIMLLSTLVILLTGCVGPKFSIEKVDNKQIYRLEHNNIATESRRSQIGSVPLEITQVEDNIYTFYKLSSDKIKDWTRFYINSNDRDIYPINCEIKDSELVCKFNREHILFIDVAKNINLIVDTKSGIERESITIAPSIAQVQYCRDLAIHSVRLYGGNITQKYQNCVNSNYRTKSIITGGTGIDTIVSKSSRFHRELKKLKQKMLLDNKKYENTKFQKYNYNKEYFLKKYDEVLTRLTDFTKTNSINNQKACIVDKTGKLSKSYIDKNFIYYIKKVKKSNYKTAIKYYEQNSHRIDLAKISYKEIDEYINKIFSKLATIEVILKHKEFGTKFRKNYNSITFDFEPSQQHKYSFNEEIVVKIIKNHNELKDINLNKDLCFIINDVEFEKNKNEN